MRCYGEFGGGKVFQIFTLTYYNTYLNTCPNKNVDDKLYCICLHRQTCFGQNFFFSVPLIHVNMQMAVSNQAKTPTFSGSLAFCCSRATHICKHSRTVLSHTALNPHTHAGTQQIIRKAAVMDIWEVYIKKRRQNNNQNKHLCILLVPLS